MKRFLTIVVLLPLWAACNRPAQVGAISPVAQDSAATCAGYCQSIGLPLGAVVIMANHVGCVCSAPAPATQPTTTGMAASAGGMTAIMLQEEAAQVAHAAYQQHHH
jgi:hypothetical protein